MMKVCNQFSNGFSPVTGVPYERPDDYYAEMIKTDEHMKTVKGVLLREKRLIDEAVERRKNRTSKKYAKQTQLQAKQQV